MTADLAIFGIRHHGPGSARLLPDALGDYKPDVVLIEGPPDADALIPLAAEKDMAPPVALLLYDAQELSRAAFYPFAEFSPEWQAMRFALKRRAEVRFMDLPMAHVFGLRQLGDADDSRGEDEDDSEAVGAETEPGIDPAARLRADPLGHLALAAGHTDGERWWDHMVERRRTSAREMFDAILEAMTALRDEAEQRSRSEQSPPRSGGPPDAVEPLREAWMRRTIRAARKADTGARIAVICGAWHAPALATMPAAAADDKLLRGLPKRKVEATWSPWTYGRLAAAAGYRAGVRSPGWYHHLWSTGSDVTERWLTRVARLLRTEEIDVSSAHIIEATRLADTLAAMRGHATAGLDELSDAIETTICAGDDTILALVHDRLIVGERLGEVPESVPAPPLLRDLDAQIKRLRLKKSADEQDLALDLRQPMQLDRSCLLHRLRALGIAWGERQEVHGKAGSFHEVWRVQWQPEFAIAIIEAGVWGSTIAEAAAGRIAERAAKAQQLEELLELLEDTLLANLPQAAAALVAGLESLTAVERDTARLLAAAPPLARAMRYGDVRGTDAGRILPLLQSVVARVCAGLPAACIGLNEEAAADMSQFIAAAHSVLLTVAEAIPMGPWLEALEIVAEADASAPAVAGRACRLLLDADRFDTARIATLMSLSLSPGADPGAGAAWLEGLLAGSGLMLLHDDRLWQPLDEWVAQINPDRFEEVAPLLRRTFSTFPAGERRMIGERVRRGAGGAGAGSAAAADAELDLERSEQSLDVIELILSAAARAKEASK